MKNKIKQTTALLALVFLVLAPIVSAGMGYTSNQDVIMIDDPIDWSKTSLSKGQICLGDNCGIEIPYESIEPDNLTKDEVSPTKDEVSPILVDEEKSEFNEKAQYPTLIVVAKVISKN